MAYEIVAKVTGIVPTWTALAARRSILALPAFLFPAWMILHLWRAKWQPS